MIFDSIYFDMNKTSNKRSIIGVCGAQNTGKSTFIKDVINSSEADFNVIEGTTTYREKIKELNLSINRKGTIESQKIIFNALCDDIDNTYSIEDDAIVLMDRTPIDAFVYTVWLYVFQKESNVTKDDINEFFSKLIDITSKMKYVIFFPVQYCKNIKLEERENRDTDETYRNQIDKIFDIVLSLLEIYFGIHLVTLYGTRKERVYHFIDYYKYHLKTANNINTLTDLIIENVNSNNRDMGKVECSM